MKTRDRILTLAHKADDAGRKELGQGYRHALAILQEEPEGFGDHLPPMIKFCHTHCFYARKSGPGTSDECSICPLAPFTLEGVQEVVDDDGMTEVQRQAEIDRRAEDGVRRMREQGLETRAAYPTPMRRGSGGLRAADE